jgi:antitoxin PrlF
MVTGTITSKGQVTIPKLIRDRLMLESGHKVDFVLTEQGDVLLRPVTKRVDDIFGVLHKTGQQPLSPEEMDAAIRKKIKKSVK